MYKVKFMRVYPWELFHIIDLELTVRGYPGSHGICDQSSRQDSDRDGVLPRRRNRTEIVTYDARPRKLMGCDAAGM